MNRYKEFAQKMKLFESGNNYKVVNQFGYLGAYQFGRPRLLDLGISINDFGKTKHPKLYEKARKLTQQEFLNNPALQDEIFLAHCKDLYRTIKRRYSQYIGKTIKGIKITMSGMIAGAHLVGLGGLIKFLTTKEDVKDGNNVSVTKYLQAFRDFNLEELDEQK